MVAKKTSARARPEGETETFPSWRYGPEGEAKICNDADDVPEGWTDHPGDFDEAE